MSKGNGVLKDKKYETLMRLYQGGKFNKAQTILRSLIEEYPDSQELKSIKYNIGLKSKHNRKASLRSNINIQKQILGWLGLIILIAAILLGGGLGIQKYQQVLSERIVDQENKLVELQKSDLISSNLENAEKLINSERYDEAILLLDEIEYLTEENQKFILLTSMIIEGKFLIGEYEKAVLLGDSSDFEEALIALSRILDINSDFRDTQILITSYEKEIKLLDFHNLASNAYENRDWSLAISYFESYLLEVDNNEKIEAKQKLYNSYLNQINENLSEETLDVDIIAESEILLSKARTLYLHNTIEYSYEDNRRIQDLLIAKFTTLAELSLEGDSQSINAIMIAENYYSKALQIQPNSQLLMDRYLEINGFLTGYSDFILGDWESAIENLTLVYEDSPNFAGGLVSVLLYESYNVTAGLYEEEELFISANDNYEFAAIVANNYPENQLRIYEVSLNLARMQARFGDFRESAFKFQEAFNDSGFYVLSQYFGGTFGESIQIAYDNINKGYYYTAYQYFIIAIEETPDFIFQENVWLLEGESLFKLSLDYSTTLTLLLEENNFNYSMLPIESGTRIMVPYLP